MSLFPAAVRFLFTGNKRLFTRCISYAQVPFFQIDSFSPAPLGGNPAAVLLLPPNVPPLPDRTLAQLAAENNLSETAFVTPLSAAPEHGFANASVFNLRWFTPTREVSLCGHGTLAAAAAIFSAAIGNPNPRLAFRTLSGELTAARSGPANGSTTIALDFPMNEPRILTRADPELAIAITIADFILGGGVEGMADTAAPAVESYAYCSNTKKLLVVLAEPSGNSGRNSPTLATWLAALRPPQPAALHAIHPSGAVIAGVSIVIPGPTPQYDFSSR